MDNGKIFILLPKVKHTGSFGLQKVHENLSFNDITNNEGRHTKGDINWWYERRHTKGDVFYLKKKVSLKELSNIG